MSTMIQIRNVPESLHRELKARAARDGMTLSDFLLREARRAVERPTWEEMKRRLAQRTRTRPRPEPTAGIRAERNGR